MVACAALAAATACDRVVVSLADEPSVRSTIALVDACCACRAFAASSTPL
jgi:hypothetical protein